MPGRGPDADDVARALAEAVARCRDAFRASAGFSYPEARLAWADEAVAHAAGTGPDADGFATVGELRNRPWGRIGFVLPHGETGDIRAVWVNDA